MLHQHLIHRIQNDNKFISCVSDHTPVFIDTDHTPVFIEDILQDSCDIDKRIISSDMPMIAIEVSKTLFYGNLEQKMVDIYIIKGDNLIDR